MILALQLIGAFFLAVALTYGLRGYALRANMLDHPGARSSHSEATPRGGGLSIVLVAVLAAFIFWGPGASFTDQLLVIVAMVLVAGVGWLDDRKHLPARYRLLVHLGAALLLVCSLWPAGVELLGVALPEWLWAICILLGVVWSINLFNFMDGINGIAGLQAVFVGLGLYALWCGHELGGIWQAEYWLVLAVASAGFLVFNFPRARVFMGDGCSGFLGMMLALGIVSLLSVSWSLFIAGVILHGVFIIDATYTLGLRLLLKENLSQAHRKHGYQKASRSLRSHTKVSLTIAGVNVLWLAPCSAAVALGFVNPLLGLIVAFAPLVGIARALGAGRDDVQSLT
ncbi:MraY family glycosyltransferase [Gilvimarinus xylanilyticus]|uniref:Glycosyltransferase family 4 protein n=1 Tax=Gilvimarinus xylanilyticus TaxID=2944139 RepID=A0A9X2I116_9GAMM|nr:glycosyltransferase family 4 protein [Gilvimarinus xylanilyticus]MCP8898370.1 glycosyltransferase family 4 protein [Gilvimarinus xylanilyticus]